MKTPTFGRARAKNAAPAAASRLIDPSMLPEKGVRYCMNHLRRMWQRGDFPPPVRLSPRRIAWPEQTIDEWIARKVAEAEQKKSA